MKKKMISVLTLALTGMLVLGGCKKVETPPTTTENTESAVEGYIKASDPSKNPVSERKDTLVIGIDAPEEVFNPLYAESAYDVYVTSTIFEGMLTADENGMPIEALAEKYSISDDGLKYTFTLKEGLKFSDGSPLTTEDVAFTYTVGSDATYDGPTDFVNSTKIKGAKAYKEGTASTIEGINIVDDKTIEFTLEEPNADAIYDFGAGILSKAYYGKDYKQGNLDYIKGFHKTPLGAGQYKLVKTVAGQEVDLVANENYHKGEPKIPNLIYKVTSEETRMQMLQTGEIDMDMVTVNQDNVQALKDAQFIDLHIFPTNGYGYIGFNFKNPKFQDQKVRQALAYGLNRKEVVDAVYAGGFADVINVPQSKLSWAYYKGDNAYEFNKDKAIELLEEAGWKVGADGIREKDGVKLEIKFTASSPNPVNDALIPVAQANYKEIGVKFEAEQMDFNAVLEKVDNGSVEMYFMAWGLTPAADATGVFGTDGAQNKISYSNAKVDELLAKGLRETDIEKRKEIYKELYTVLNEDLPYIFLYQRRDMWAVNSRVKGFEDQITPYKDFTQSLYKLTLE
ncbi:MULTISPECIES: ABC transporter substrate-binding protein [unclassified Clostridium]|uniref:ABC transporter substrate-binding protein n=1 Tax=unclassified Clostridium TaxID=2614128 RepID=UPI0025B8EF71|nr:ABC transporter substrate-binding protein [Clostridium sp.]MDY4253476.1 ABC transporter substrate-binding protein [Clostridium sp.]